MASFTGQFTVVLALVLATNIQPRVTLAEREQFNMAAQGGSQDKGSGGGDHARERMEEFLRRRMPQDQQTEEFLRKHLPQDDTATQQDHTKQKPDNDRQDSNPKGSNPDP